MSRRRCHRTPASSSAERNCSKTWASAYGEYYASALPHTGLRLNVSSKYFLRPSGVDDGRGVVPDIHIPCAGIQT